MVHPEKAKNGHFGHFGQFCKNGHFNTISLKKRVFEDPQNPYFWPFLDLLDVDVFHNVNVFIFLRVNNGTY